MPENNSPDPADSSSRGKIMRTCVVTIVIGDQYLKDYNRHIRRRFEAYCGRHGYDLMVIKEPIRDLPGKKYTWQKQCIMDLPWFYEYDQIAVLDSDILISRDAPPLPVTPAGKIAAVPDKLPLQLNSGVLVFRPGPEVAEVFEASLEDDDPFWDQKALTRELVCRKMVHFLDRRFNRQFYFYCWSLPGSLLRRHWFYHACHGKSKISLIRLWLGLTFR
jgi:hypothetical protein